MYFWWEINIYAQTLKRALRRSSRHMKLTCYCLLCCLVFYLFMPSFCPIHRENHQKNLCFHSINKKHNVRIGVCDVRLTYAIDHQYDNAPCCVSSPLNHLYLHTSSTVRPRCCRTCVWMWNATNTSGRTQSNLDNCNLVGTGNSIHK